jgi:hypothetical protein
MQINKFMAERDIVRKINLWKSGGLFLGLAKNFNIRSAAVSLKPGKLLIKADFQF